MIVIILILLLCHSAHLNRLLHFDSCIEEKCFAFVEDARRWTDARDYCKSHNGSLAEPMNEKEYEVIHHMCKTKRVWIGGIYHYNEKTWTWDYFGNGIDDMNGENVFQELNARETNNNHIITSKRCLVLEITNKIKLFSDNCNTQHAFVCSNNGLKTQSNLTLNRKRRKTLTMIQPTTWEHGAILNTSCGGTFSGSQGVIETPNFPNMYTDWLYCEYHITVPEGHNISLTFHGYDVEIVSDCTLESVCINQNTGEPVNPCLYDNFTVFENLPRDVDGTIKLLNETCGESKDELLVTSSTNNIYVYFQTDTLEFGKGFNASWSIILTTTTTTTAAVNNPCIPNLCGEGSCNNGSCDFCSPNQCVGGTCLSKPSKQFEEGQFNFTCICDKGQNGPYCKISDDPCKSNPCKNGGTCNVVEKPGANDWICDCEGKPFIGQRKDCSDVRDRGNVNYPIPDKAMLAIASFPFAVLGICCVVYGVYECIKIGELPDLDLAPKSSRRATITSVDLRPIHRDEEIDSYGIPKVISDKYRGQRKKTKKSMKYNQVSKKAKTISKGKGSKKSLTPKRNFGIKRKYGKGLVGIKRQVENETDLDYQNPQSERKHILAEITDKLRASLFFRKLTGYTDNVTIELGHLELGEHRADNHQESVEIQDQ